MPSLNVDIDYFNHPKTKRLVRLLGRGSEVLPLKLWVYTARYFTDSGILTGISAQEIEDECQWWGKPEEMVNAMLDPCVNFLDLNDQTYSVHDWAEHEGHLSAFKERAKKAAEERWNNARNRDASSNAISNAISNAPTSIPKPTNQKEDIAALPPAAEPKPKKPRKPPTGDHADLIRHWCQGWEGRYRKPFPFKAQAGRNGKHIQTLLDTLGLKESATAMDRYFACDDGFLNGHPLGMLLSQLSKFVVDAPTVGDLDPSDARMLKEMENERRRKTQVAV